MKIEDRYTQQKLNELHKKAEAYEATGWMFIWMGAALAIVLVLIIIFSELPIAI